MLQEFENKVQREIEIRMHENLLEWEEEYKAKHIIQLRETIAEELRIEFEAKLQEIIEKERT